MPPTLTLLDFPASPVEGWDSLSPFVLKVVRALRAAKLPFTHEHVPLVSVPLKAPNGQLPALRVGDEVVADSTAILQRIDNELAPGAFTAQLDERARREAWLWEEFADTALYPYGLASRWLDEENWQRYRPAMFGGVPIALRSVTTAFVRRGIKQNMVARDFTRSGGVAACYARLDRVLDGLEVRAPARGFWVGDALSVADMSLFGQLHSLRAPFTPQVAAKLAQRPTLSAYLDRVDAATVR